MTVEMNLPENSHQADRVRSHTSAEVNQKIDQAIASTLTEYANQPKAQITDRIAELNREWDTERVLETNASVLAFTGLILGIFVNPNWLWLTGIVLPFLFQHAVQGWCPPLPIIRRLGVRTRQEIDREILSLKILRGDFANLPDESQNSETRVHKALEVVGMA